MNNKSDVFDDQSVVRRVELLLIDAIEKQASDIHLEQTNEHLRVRFRIDGMLIEQQPFSSQLSSSIVGRLKILAHLNIAERRIPQDGKFQINHNNNHIDVRISTFPALYGEKMVIRILDRLSHMITLDSIGFEPTVLATFKRLMQRQNGFFLVTGPTGSGKTTTLYASLLFLNTPEKNIVTLEDPVEYSLDGITQAQVNTATGFTFEKGMRSLVRQDPDIIMVGEIRDKITARIAVEASLTGHLVLSSLHTGHAVGAITRLMDMGIEPFLIAAALSGVLAQRLVRTLCSKCREQRPATEYEKNILQSYDAPADYVYQHKGCDACDGLGYKGRIGIFEFLEISPEFRSLMMKHGSYDEMKKQAAQDGMKTLMQDGARKVAQGAISFEDFMRIIL